MWWICRDGLDSGWRVVDRIEVDAAAVTFVAFSLRFSPVGVTGHPPFFPSSGHVWHVYMSMSMTHPDLFSIFKPTPLRVPLQYPALRSGRRLGEQTGEHGNMGSVLLPGFILHALRMHSSPNC